MASAVDISLVGDKALTKKLHRLEGPAQKRIVRKGLRVGAKPVLAAAKAKVPVKTGRTKAGLKIRSAGRSRSRIGVVVKTPPRAALGIAADDPNYYPMSVEYGHSTKGGGHVPARPFMRPALDENAQQVLGIIRREIGAGIEREARKG